MCKTIFVVRDKKEIFNAYTERENADREVNNLNISANDKYKYYVEIINLIEISKQVIKTNEYSQACPICIKPVNWIYCKNCGQKLKY